MNKDFTEEQLKKLCSQIEKLTDLNDHNEAVRIACGFFGYDDLHAVMTVVKNLHYKARCMSDELLAIRTECKRVLMRNLHSDYSESVYQAVKNSY